jgi:SPP1 gp7 family putative phage head morphogenesis protein
VGWLAGQGVDLIAALTVIRALRAEGYVIGQRAATAILSGSATVDWSSWAPGHADAARLVASTGATSGLETLLDDAGVTIRSVAANRLDKLAQALSDALARGDSADTLGRDLRGILDDPAWAERLAVTEIARGVSAATAFTYQVNGIRQVSWLTAVDQRVCAVCVSNEDVGPIPLGTSFPSNVQYPPAHPSCRCTLYPETGL